MGFFDFFSDAGKKVLGSEDDAGAVKAEIENSFAELPIQGLVTEVNGETVSLGGVAVDNATKEKAILIAGNIEGISQVNADQLVTMEDINAQNTRTEDEPAPSSLHVSTLLPKAIHFGKSLLIFTKMETNTLLS